MSINSCKKVINGFLFFISLFIISISCDSTEPTDDLKPGRRDYTWTVDTLANIAPSNSYTELWGYDPQHVWVAGDSWDIDKNILEFNGSQWRNLALPSQPPAPAPWALWGTDPNNIWAAGDVFFKYDGNRFNIYNKYSLEGFTNLTTIDICGYSKDNLYAIGGAYHDTTGQYHPYIMHFNGGAWEVINLQLDKFGSFLKVRSEINSPNILFILYYEENTHGNDFYRILKYSNNGFTELHNTESNINDNPCVTIVSGEVTFGWDKKVFQLSNGQPKLLYDFSSTSKSTSSVHGRSEKDLFFEAADGLGHFNGEDIKILYPIDKKFYIMNCLFFEKEVFILYYEFGSFKFYVLRGKLDD